MKRDATLCNKCGTVIQTDGDGSKGQKEKFYNITVSRMVSQHCCQGDESFATDLCDPCGKCMTEQLISILKTEYGAKPV